jgi:uncharacterized protein YhfF
MTCNADSKACWECYRRSLPAEAAVPPSYFEASAFGAEGETELADLLVALVEQGAKTATATLLRHYQAGNHPIEQVGDCCIVLASTGQPRCIIELTMVRTIPFGNVDAAFAADYGEGERTLVWWREHLGDYYARQSVAAGWSFGAETPLVCKRFRVVFRCASPSRPSRSAMSGETQPVWVAGWSKTSTGCSCTPAQGALPNAGRQPATADVLPLTPAATGRLTATPARRRHEPTGAFRTA